MEIELNKGIKIDGNQTSAKVYLVFLSAPILFTSRRVDLFRPYLPTLFPESNQDIKPTHKGS